MLPVAIASHYARVRLRVRQSWMKVPGRVEEHLPRGRLLYPVIRCAALSGERLLVSSVASAQPSLKVGETVEVYLNPEDPEQAALPDQSFSLPILLSVIGLIFFAGGLSTLQFGTMAWNIGALLIVAFLVRALTRPDGSSLVTRFRSSARKAGIGKYLLTPEEYETFKSSWIGPGNPEHPGQRKYPDDQEARRADASPGLLSPGLSRDTVDEDAHEQFMREGQNLPLHEPLHGPIESLLYSPFRRLNPEIILLLPVVGMLLSFLYMGARLALQERELQEAFLSRAQKTVGRVVRIQELKGRSRAFEGRGSIFVPSRLNPKVETSFHAPIVRYQHPMSSEPLEWVYSDRFTFGLRPAPGLNEEVPLLYDPQNPSLTIEDAGPLLLRSRPFLLIALSLLLVGILGHPFVRFLRRTESRKSDPESTDRAA